MSQYLSFYLKHKESGIQLCAGYFCTTPARQIDSIGAFPYTEKEKELTKGDIELYINNIKSEINSIKEYKEKESKHKVELVSGMYRCSSKEAAEFFYDKVFDSENLINEYTEELEDWEYRLNKITLISEMYNDNNDDWDLYYINC